ncbi:MAG: DEAD/DEAH box helicase [Candidatus Competibacteraceae bacterium]|nr:DEAD/DEAH box helicase [Candidatus Competibacteraceae bacterium]
MLNSETEPFYTPRDYQREALRMMVSKFRDGITHQIFSLATGSGKSLIAAWVPRYFKLGEGKLTGKKLLFLVHREGLLLDVAERMRRNNPGLKVGLEQGKLYADLDCDIICASVQTLGINHNKRQQPTAEQSFWAYLMEEEFTPIWGNRRIERFNPDDFPIIIIDECHHAAAAQYAPLLKHFGVYLPDKPTQKKLLLGFTATPFRADNIGLDSIFQEIVYERDILTGIEAGSLVDVDAFQIETEVSLDKINTSSSTGDFAIKALEEAVNTPIRNNLVVEAYKKFGKALPGIAFAVDIQHANDIQAAFREAGIAAKALNYKTPTEEREEAIQALKDRKLKILISASLLAEGSDIPEATVALMCRPTKSKGFFIQMLGRVLRPFPSPEDLAKMRASGIKPKWIKDKAIVLDFLDASRKHNLINVNSIFGIPPKLKLDKTVAEMAREIEQIKMKAPNIELDRLVDAKALRTRARKVDLFKRQKLSRRLQPLTNLAWYQVSDEEFVLVMPSNKDFADSYMVRLDLLGRWEILSSKNSILRKLEGTYTDLKDAIVAVEKIVPPELRAVLRIGGVGLDNPPTSKQISAYAYYYLEERQKFRDFKSFYEDTFKRFTRRELNVLIVKKKKGPAWFLKKKT